MKLTDTGIKALLIKPKGQKTYWDDTLKGFGCRVSQGGTKSFVVQHGFDRRLITIGRYPIITLADARTEAKRILAELTLGRHRPRTVRWDEALGLYLAACEEKNRKRTVHAYRRLACCHTSSSGSSITGLELSQTRPKASSPSLPKSITWRPFFLTCATQLHSGKASSLFSSGCQASRKASRNMFFWTRSLRYEPALGN